MKVAQIFKFNPNIINFLTANHWNNFQSSQHCKLAGQHWIICKLLKLIECQHGMWLCCLIYIFLTTSNRRYRSSRANHLGTVFPFSISLSFLLLNCRDSWYAMSVCLRQVHPCYKHSLSTAFLTICRILCLIKR